VLIAARPEDFALTTRHPGADLNVMTGKIGYRVFLGELIDYIVDHGNGEIRVRAQPDCEFAVGEAVHVAIPPHKCVGFRR
jgi:ABC-type Fe3+/spermidine/putrescine transport system ATPase subunit